MAQFKQWFEQDFTDKIEIRHCESVMFTGDDKGALVGVRLFDNGAAYSGGGTVTGAVKRSDGGLVALTGTLSGNAASVVIPAAALAYPGPIGVHIILTQGGSVTTVLKAIYSVDDNSGAAVDPGTIIPSINDLITAINTAVASIPSDYSALLHTLAPDFSTSNTYYAGDYVWYNGTLYRFTANHAAGSWTGTDAAAAVIGNDLGDLKSAIDDLPEGKYHSSSVTNDRYLNSEGELISQVGWSVSDFLKIGQNAKYFMPSGTTSTAIFCWLYDENKEKIESFTTPIYGWHELQNTQASFVRFSIKTSEITRFQYITNILIPYKDGIIIPQLIQDSKMIYSYENEAHIGIVYSTSGDINPSANWAILPLYSVNTGDVFFMDYPYSQYLTCFDADKQFVSAQIAPENGTPITFTIPDGVAYIGVNLLKSRLGTYTITLNGKPLGAKYKLSWMRDSIWENKAYISHGDSITWQDGEAYIQGEHIGEIAKGYQTVFSANVNLSRKTNMGKSGWSMAVVNGNGVVNTILSVSNYAQFDLCTIACGTNDFKLNVPIGTLGQIGDTSFDDTTFYGAYRKAVEYILTNSPTIRLVLMTPLQRDNSGYDVNYTNSAGHKLIDYVNAVKAVGEMYGLPVCDMYANSGFTKKTLTTYTMDGLHPNDIGYKRMGDYLTGFLNAVGN